MRPAILRLADWAAGLLDQPLGRIVIERVAERLQQRLVAVRDPW